MGRKKADSDDELMTVLSNTIQEEQKEKKTVKNYDVEELRKKLTEEAVRGKLKEFSEKYDCKFISKASPEELMYINGLFEIKLKHSIQSSIGVSIIDLYSNGISKFIPIEDSERLAKDLKNNPFIEQLLNKAAFEVYERYGFMFAPVSIATITAKHIEDSEQAQDISSSSSELAQKSSEQAQKSFELSQEQAQN